MSVLYGWRAHFPGVNPFTPPAPKAQVIPPHVIGQSREILAQRDRDGWQAYAETVFNPLASEADSRRAFECAMDAFEALLEHDRPLVKPA